MAQKNVKQGANASNEGWPNSFTMSSGQDQVKFLSRGANGRVTIESIPSAFTPVGGNSGKAVVYNYSGAAGASWDVEAEADPDPNGARSENLSQGKTYDVPSDKTKLTITGG